MTISDLVQWWNLIFVVPFVAAVGFLLLMTTGLVASEMTGDIDADIALDHGDLDGAHGHGDWDGLNQVFDFLGLGRAPLSVVLMSFCFVWGLSGVTANYLFENLLPGPSRFIWLSACVALLISIVVTHFVAHTMARVMPSGESYATERQELVGKVATVRFRITENSGTAQLYDKYANLHEVSCRVPPGEAGFGQGERIVLMDYDEERKVFIARIDPLHELGIEDNPPAGSLR